MFLLPQDKDSFLLKLEDTENWLYEEGEDEKKQVYIDKLACLTVSVKSSEVFIQSFEFLNLNRM